MRKKESFGRSEKERTEDGERNEREKETVR
jgi:hypothetical protein